MDYSERIKELKKEIKHLKERDPFSPDKENIEQSIYECEHSIKTLEGYNLYDWYKKEKIKREKQ